MNSLIITLAIAYAAFGVYYTFRVFDPKTIGGIFLYCVYGAIFGPLVFALIALGDFLTIKVRK